MLHPMKHEFRSRMSDAVVQPLYQLVLMNHASVFINDAKLAGRVINQMKTKGPMYNAFRFDPNTPDILASDGDPHSIRSDAFRSSLLKISSSAVLNRSDVQIFDSLLERLKLYSESGAPLGKSIVNRSSISISISIMISVDLVLF